MAEIKVYDKIIRDKIPEIIEKNGATATIEVVDKTKALSYLIQKIDEEKNEFIEALEAKDKKASTEELADLLEIIHGIAHHLDIPFQTLETLRQDKKNKRGGFEDRLILKETKK